jgi:hypothetical protein
MNIDSFHYIQTVKKFIITLPDVEEYTCFGTPAFRVNKKFLGRLREDGESFALRNEERNKWIKKNPSVYFVTEHYENYPVLLIHLSKAEEKELHLLLFTAWQLRATRKQLKEYEERKIR